MKRRDFLLKLGAGSVAVVLVPAAIAESDGVSLYSTAPPQDLTEESLERLCEELRADTVETIEVNLPVHEFHPYSARCIHCGVTQLWVEEGYAPVMCYAQNFRLPLSSLIK
ncbi:MAG TPA: hypothetical protein VLH80_07360 [Nitrospiraceae bacterium]|nr:hypothetical protein [Nitrospiraceae bacterium]